MCIKLRGVRLKPCPFCGGTNITPNSYMVGNHIVVGLKCEDCKMLTVGYNADTIRLWNYRADEDVPKRVTVEKETKDETKKCNCTDEIQHLKEQMKRIEAEMNVLKLSRIWH